MDGDPIALTRSLQLAAVVGYLLGSVPWGLLLTRLTGKGDLRNVGSGNIGATNVLRAGGKGLAIATLLLDAGKGVAAVLIMGQWGENEALIAGLLAVIGHNFPIWLRFRGGKGVATTLGVVTAWAWPVGLIACGVWLLIASAFRYSSLAALVALAVAPVAMFLVAGASPAVVTALLAALGFLRHHANIRRLIRGEESKIKLRSSPPKPAGDDGGAPDQSV